MDTTNVESNTRAMKIRATANRISASLGALANTYPARVGAATGAFWIVVPLIVAVPSFAVNDDIGIRDRATGDLTGSPSHYLVFINVVYGVVLRGLYTVVPDFPWYSFLFYALQAVSVAVVVYVALRTRRALGVWAVIVLMGWLAYSIPQETLLLTFTSTAILAAGAGVLLLMFTLGTSRDPIAFVIAIGLIVVASLIRANSLWVVLLVFSVPLLRVLIRTPLRLTALVVLVVVAVPVGTGLLDRWYTGRSEAWAAYNEFNAYRGLLHGTTRLTAGEHLDPVLAEVGWTQLELSLFAGFIYPDPDVFTTEAVRKVWEATPSRQPDQSIAEDLRDVWRPYLLSIVVSAAILSWHLVGAARRRRPGEAVWLLATVTAFLAPMVYLALHVRFPPQVAAPLWALLPLALLLEPGFAHGEGGKAIPDREHGTRHGFGLALAVAAALVLAGVGIARIDALSDSNHARRTALEQSLDVIRETDPNGVFVYRGSDVAVDGADPLAAHSPDVDGPKLLGLGWSTFSPPWHERRAALGINNVFVDIVADPHVYFVGKGIDAIQIADFASRHYGVVGRPYPVAKLPEDKYVWAYSNPAEWVTGGGQTAIQQFGLGATSGPAGEDPQGHVSVRTQLPCAPGGPTCFDLRVQARVTCMGVTGGVTGGVATIIGEITSITGTVPDVVADAKSLDTTVTDSGWLLPDEFSSSLSLAPPPGPQQCGSGDPGIVPVTQGNIVVEGN